MANQNNTSPRSGSSRMGMNSGNTSRGRKPAGTEDIRNSANDREETSENERSDDQAGYGGGNTTQ